jgi:hypothetical protein
MALDLLMSWVNRFPGSPSRDFERFTKVEPRRDRKFLVRAGPMAWRYIPPKVATIGLVNGSDEMIPNPSRRLTISTP